MPESQPTVRGKRPTGMLEPRAFGVKIALRVRHAALR